MTQEIERLALFRYLIITFVFFNLTFFAQSHPEAKIERLLRQGISEIVKQNYNSADKIFRELDDTYPNNPLGKIYIAATLIAESYDLETPYDDKTISSLLEEAKKQSEDLLKKDRNNIWNKYYLALVEGYSAYYQAISGNLLKALSVGLNSYNLFNEILQMDSSFHDALIAIGTYKYWKSDKLQFLSWLPFVEDEREIGIKHLESSINNNSYNSHLAIYSLVWIFIHKKDFDKAKILAESALRKFPQSRVFREALARVYEDIDLNQSVVLYNQVLNSYQQLNLENRVRIITLKHKIAIQLNKLGRKSQALRICNEILSINDFTEFERNKLNDRLEKVKNLKKELNG